MTIEVWLLMIWSATAVPFEGGQYQTEARCERAAEIQLPYWRGKYGMATRWSCELKRM